MGMLERQSPRWDSARNFLTEKLRNTCPGFRGALEILEIITCKILCEYTSLWGAAFITFSKGIVIPLEGYNPDCAMRMEVEQESGECWDLRDRWDENPEGDPRRSHWKRLRTQSKYNVTEASSLFIIYFFKNLF